MTDVEKGTSAAQMEPTGLNYILKLFGFKAISICIAVALAVSLSICVRFSLVDGKYEYSSNTVVMCVEISKFVISMIMLTREVGTSGVKEKFSNWKMKTSLPFLVPGLLYMINNNLEFVLRREIDIARFSAIANLKILTSGILFRVFLGRELTSRKWLGLLLLTLGVSLTEYKPDQVAEEGSSFSTYSICLAMLYCSISGFAGCYTQYIFQNKGDAASESIHFQNLNLYTYGIIFNMLGMVKDFDKLSQDGFFTGYNFWTCMVILCYASIGLVISAIMKYADVLFKCFTNAGAMVSSTIFAVIFFQFEVTMYFMFGCIIISLAVYLYTVAPKK